MKSLDLLDDAHSHEPNSAAWEDLLKTAQAKRIKAAAAQEDAKKAALIAAKQLQSAQRNSSQRIFSSRPTLRQLMREYNRPVARTAPIRLNDGDEVPEFNVERIDMIRLPSIPGKILRPARPPNAKP